MRLSITKLAQGAAHWAFLTLFPGFFFYHSALGLGVIGPVLGGFFSPVAALFGPVLAAFYARQLLAKAFADTRIDLAFFGFIGYFLLVVALNFVDGAHVSVIQNHILAAGHLTTLFLMFRLADFRSPWFRRAALASLIAMTVIVFAYSVQGLFYLKPESESESVATYQGFARSYMLTLLVLLPFTGRRLARLVLYVFGLPALYLNGARSEFVAVIAAVAVLEYAFSRRRSLLLLAAGTLAAIVAVFSTDIIAMLPENRVLQLLDLAQDSSAQTRNEFLGNALATIQAHPLLGDYASYATAGAGTYTHNVLSAWVDLGLLGFVYLTLLLLVPAYRLTVRVVSRTRLEAELLLAFALLFVCVLLLGTAKEFTYMPIGAALGAYASYRSKMRSARAERRA